VDYSYATTETNHLRELITAVFDAVNRLHQNTPESIALCAQGIEGIEAKYFEEIQNKLEAANAYTTAHMDRIELAQERQAEVWKLIEGDIADDRFIGGLFKFYFSSFILVTTIVSSGGALPLLIAGAPLSLYEAAEISESVQEIGYGIKGDGHTESFNFMRDGLFQGNQFAYDIYGMVSSGIYAATIPTYSYAMAMGNKTQLRYVCISASAEATTTWLNEIAMSEICNALNISEENAYFLNMAAGAVVAYGVNKTFEQGMNWIERNRLKKMVSGGNITAKANAVKDYEARVEGGKNSIVIKGGTYENLDTILKKYNLSEAEYIKLSRTPQHQLNIQNRELVYKIRMELTADVTNYAGVVNPGTQISKSIDADSFKNFYKDGNRATIGGCTALKRDTDALLSDLELIDSTGLRFEGSHFINTSGDPNVFYLVEGELMSGQPDLVVRVSATTDSVNLSDEVVNKFSNKHPDYLYNGYKINDVSSANNTYLNEIWTRNSEKQVSELSKLTGVSTDNIVTEEARFYNRATNPDTGTGITLNQGNSNAMGIPEFFANKGRVGIMNGRIYKIEGDKRILVAKIGRTGKIKLVD